MRPAQEARYVVPRQAIREGRVFIADAENRLRIRPVTVDYVQGDDAILQEGVATGDRVVVTDLVPAIEGMLLAPETETATR